MYDKIVELCWWCLASEATKIDTCTALQTLLTKSDSHNVLHSSGNQHAWLYSPPKVTIHCAITPLVWHDNKCRLTSFPG